MGLDLGSTNISAIFFADDIIILGKSTAALSALMDITRIFFSNHKLELSEKKSKLMSHDANTGYTTFTGSPPTNPITLEQVLSFKYLGIPINCSPYNMFKCFNEQVRKRAQSYLASVLSLVKTGPDRADLAYTLWTCCALPSILYGTEVIPLTQTTISEIDKCQSKVGKFILQLPRSSASVSASLDAGLKPVWAVIAEKVLVYASTTMKKPAQFWPRIAMNVNMDSGYKSPYTNYLMKWRTATDSTLLSTKLIRQSTNRAAIIHVLEEQKLCSTTTFAMNPPEPHSVNKWFKPKAWVTDSCRTKILSQFRACNANLGNRGPTRDGRFFKLCPLCANHGTDAINNEVEKNITFYMKFTYNFRCTC